MLIEKVKRHATRDRLTAKSFSKMTFILSSHTSVRVFIRLEMENGWIKEGICAHEGRDNILDHQSWWIVDACFSPSYIKRETHDIFLFHAFDNIATRQRTTTNDFYKLLVLFSQLGQIHSFERPVNVIVHLLVEVLVLNSSFIESFLVGWVAQCFKGKVIELSNLDVGDTRLSYKCFSNDFHDLCCLLLSCLESAHEIFPGSSVFELHDWVEHICHLGFQLFASLEVLSLVLLFQEVLH